MKRAIVLLLLFLVGGVAAPNGTEIIIEFTKSAKVMPDTYSFGLHIFMKDPKEKVILNTLGAVDKTIRNLKISYEGGRYELHQNCFWQKEKRICEGYKGSVSYRFFLKNPQKQNEIFEAIENLKKRMQESFHYSVVYPHWQISQSKQNQVIQKLQLGVIDKAKVFGKQAGKRLAKQCDIKSIDYITRLYPVVKSMAAKASVQAPQPAKEEQSMSVRAKVRFICD
ncbi:hypothetical protein [Nitratiruptor tergarcus]|nr:hypothetical protein [Nitratiruptor tergarcus]